MKPFPSGSFWRRALHPRSRPLRWIERILVVVAVLLVVLRLAAPWLLQRMINDRLSRIPDYSGHVGDIDLALWRGAYVVDDVEIRKRQGAVNVPFFSARQIDFSLSWPDLFHGRIVGDVNADAVKVNFARAESPEGSQLATDRRWQDLIQDIFPIEIQHLKVSNGDVHYIDKSRSPEVDVSVKDVQLVASGLRNRRTTTASGEVMPAQMSLTGNTVGDGSLEFKAALAPLEPQPYFDVTCAVRGVQLTALNTFLRAFANIDVSQGTFDLFLEVVGRDGAYEGYVKPFFQDLDFKNLTDEKRTLPGRIWESIVATLNSIVKNHPRDQLGTRVPFRGTFGGLQVGTFSAILNAIRHGFVQAFSESIEGNLRPDDVVPAKTPAADEAHGSARLSP